MRRLEIFGDNVDYLLPAFAACTLIFLFYGPIAAIAAGVFVLATMKLKPLRRKFSEKQVAVIAAGVVLTFSIFLRSLFYSEYCSSAIWSVNGDMSSFLGGTEMPCFINGGYLQYAWADTWRSLLRDIAMPVAGISTIVAVLPSGPTRKLGSLSAIFLLFLGLLLNSPLFKHSASDPGEELQLGATAERTGSPQPLVSVAPAGEEASSPELSSPKMADTDESDDRGAGARQQRAELEDAPGMHGCTFSGTTRGGFSVWINDDVATLTFAGLEMVEFDEERSTTGWSIALAGSPQSGSLSGRQGNGDYSSQLDIPIGSHDVVDLFRAAPRASSISLFRNGELVEAFEIALTPSTVKALADCAEI